MTFAVSIERRNADGAYDLIGRFEERLVSKAVIRRRVDQDPWSPGVPVLDDVDLEIAADDWLLGPASMSYSAFSAGLREHARVTIDAAGATLFRGFVKDSDSPYDLTARTQALRAVSPATLLKDARVPPGIIAAGQPWTEAIRAIFAAGAAGLTLAADAFEAMRVKDLPFDVDGLRIGDAAPLTRLSLYDAMNALLSPVLGVMLISPEGEAHFRPRDADTGKEPILLEDGDALDLKFASGAARAVRSVSAPHADGEEIRAVGAFGGGADVTIQSEWLGGRVAARIAADYVLRAAAPLRTEVQAQWPDDRGVPGMLDPVKLNFGDGDRIGSVNVGGARLSSSPREPAINGVYRAYDVAYDLRERAVNCIMRA